MKFWNSCLNINAFQGPSECNQGVHDMSALQPWLNFNSMAHHKSEKTELSKILNRLHTLYFLLHLQLFIRFSSNSSVHLPSSSSSFSASFLSRQSIILRVAAQMRMMIDYRAARACVPMGEINKSVCFAAGPDLCDDHLTCRYMKRRTVVSFMGVKLKHFRNILTLCVCCLVHSLEVLELNGQGFESFPGWSFTGATYLPWIDQACSPPSDRAW